MMRSSRFLLSVLSGLALSSSLVAPAMAQRGVRFSDPEPWQVSDVRGQESGGQDYCVLSRAYSDKVAITIAENKQGEASIALHFMKGQINTAALRDVVFDPGAGQQRVSAANPLNDTSFVARIGRDPVFFKALQETGYMRVGMGGASYSFDLADFDQGQSQLSACIASLATSDDGEAYVAQGAVVQPEPVEAESVSAWRDDAAHQRLERELERSDRRIETLVADIDRLKADKHDLEKAVAAAERDDKAFDLDALQKRSGDLVKQLEAARGAHDDLQDSLDVERDRSLALQTEIERLERDGETSRVEMEKEISALQEELQAAQAEIVRLDVDERNYRQKAGDDIAALQAQLKAAEQQASADGQAQALQLAQLTAERDELEKVLRVHEDQLKAGSALQEDLQADIERLEATGKVQQKDADRVLADTEEKLALAEEALKAETDKVTALQADLHALSAAKLALSHEASQETADLMAQLEAREAELASLEAVGAQQEKAATMAADEVEDLTVQLEAAQNKIMRLEQTGDEQQKMAEGEVADLMVRLEAAELRVDELENAGAAQQKTAKAELSELTAKLEAAEAKVASLETESEAQQLAAGDEVADLTAQLQAREAEIAILKETGAEQQKLAKGEVKDLAKSLKAAEDKLAALEAESEAQQEMAESEVADLVAKLEAAEGRATDLRVAGQAQQDLAAGEVEDLTVRLKAAEKQVAALEKSAERQQEAAEGDVADLIAKLETAEGKLAALEEDSAEQQELAESEVADLMAKLEAAEGKVAVLEKDGAVQQELADNEVADLAAQLEAAEAKIAGFERNGAEQQEAAHNELVSLTAQLEAAQAQVKALEATGDEQQKTAEGEAAQLTELLAAAEARVATLEKTSEEQQIEMAALVAERDGLKHVLDEQEARSGQVAQVQTDLQVQMEALVVSNEALTVENASLKEHAAVHEAQLAGLRDSLVEREQAYEEIAARLDKADRALVESDGQKHELARRLSDAEAARTQQVDSVIPVVDGATGEAREASEASEAAIVVVADTLQEETEEVVSVVEDTVEEIVVEEQSAPAVARVDAVIEPYEPPIVQAYQNEAQRLENALSQEVARGESVEPVSEIVPDTVIASEAVEAPVTVEIADVVFDDVSDDVLVESDSLPVPVEGHVAEEASVAHYIEPVETVLDEQAEAVAAVARKMEPARGVETDIGVDIQTVAAEPMLVEDPVIDRSAAGRDTVSAMLLEAGIAPSAAVQSVAGAAADGVEMYQWQVGPIYGSSEQQLLANSVQFDDKVKDYLVRTQARCDGDFAVIPADSTDYGDVRVDSYDVACMQDGVQASASVMFYHQDGAFAAVAHEGEVTHMDTVMDLRDRLVASLSDRS